MIRNGCSLVLADPVKTKLDQVFGFIPAAGPPVPLFELNTKQVVYFVELAVFCAGLAAIRSELERNHRAGRNRFFDLETCAGWRNILEDRPLAVSRAGSLLPLNSDQIGAKFSIFLSP